MSLQRWRAIWPAVAIDDEPGLAMPRYYFHLVRGAERVADAHGIALFEDEATPEFVARIMNELQAEEPDLFVDRDGWCVEMTDADGQVLNRFEV